MVRKYSWGHHSVCSTSWQVARQKDLALGQQFRDLPARRKSAACKLYCLGITVSQNIILTVAFQHCGFVASGLHYKAECFGFCFFLRHLERMHLPLPSTRKAQNMVEESSAPLHPGITPKCRNDVLDRNTRPPSRVVGVVPILSMSSETRAITNAPLIKG